jgi:2-isopropylmalate synthase
MLRVLDSTLREGEQTPGVYFDSHIKLAIADLLDQLGIDIIEAGHPMVTEEIHQAVTRLARRGLNARVGAHSRSLEADVDQALESGVSFLGIFYCVSDDRLTNVFRKGLTNAVDQIARIIAYARARNPELLIRYTPEDTVRSEFGNVVDAAVAAVNAGADIISVADTTGFMIPGTENNMYDYVLRLREALAQQGHEPVIAVHCHNDRGFALANALDGFRAGARIIDATVLGLGERAGIVDLAQLLVTLTDRLGVASHWKLDKLPELYDLVGRYAGVPTPVNYPITGENAFRHCAGVHTHAAIKNPAHYQSLDPAIVGRKMEVALDHMSGLSSVEWAMDELQIEWDRSLAEQALKIIKSVGQRGRTVDFAELKHIVEWVTRHPLIEEDS